jgi:hypothetical protein
MTHTHASFGISPPVLARISSVFLFADMLAKLEAVFLAIASALTVLAAAEVRNATTIPTPLHRSTSLLPDRHNPALFHIPMHTGHLPVGITPCVRSLSRIRTRLTVRLEISLHSIGTVAGHQCCTCARICSHASSRRRT